VAYLILVRTVRAFVLVAALAIAFSVSAHARTSQHASEHPLKRRLYDQIGRVWYRDVQANLQKIALGTVRIHVTASRDGKIINLRVVSNTSNRLLAQISLAAIREAKIAAVPAELLSQGKFEDEISFTIFPK
jgi:outer membrane biosynthesis protein TonB